MEELWSVKALIIVVTLHFAVFFSYLTYVQFVVYRWLKDVYKTTPKLIDIKRRIFDNEATVEDAEFLMDPSDVIEFDKIIYFKSGILWKCQDISNYAHTFQQLKVISSDLRIHLDPDSTRSQKDRATSMWMIKDYYYKSLAWMIKFDLSIRSIEIPLILTGIVSICLALTSAYYFITV